MTTTVFITSGTSTVIPSNWNSSNNSVDCIGGGGGASYRAGAGGGEWRQNTNQSYTKGATRTCAIGAGGAGATSNGSAGGNGTATSIKQDNNSTTARFPERREWRRV